MLTFRSPAEVPAGFGPSAVTIGKFDGVHVGHRAVISRLLERAREQHLAAAVVTFDRNPLSLLRPELCPDALVSNAQKLENLAATGIDATLMLTFDRALSEQTPEQFVREVLVDALHARVVLVGHDFRFGARGAGDLALLERLGAELGFGVEMISDITPDGARRVSSTWIRELLGEGRVREATDLLGAPPAIRSVVVHGEQRGRTLGFPTANLAQEIEGYVPADGVYAAWMTVGGERYPAAVSIGNNPTFEGVLTRQVEAHAIDAQLDIYGEPIELAFVEYVRGMHKFEGADALARQMAADEARIREILGVPPRV
ncbi:bifunctional riboflavin kinase/FAD synthetase [Leifsonia sp. H3M29-4]|uniref:bifunctional riboflavin kinase/FAD synthetase n=1 Tax=Salinibacterium metalliresistens TaxID=3031321 RepID=UPI0023DC8D42|nr:bifunctional riboflavin kinase/FAD synthetase [Salinibacterium metalliresistens]MDF1480068.1 bifunctional riboflavin kinase/FAD synthetase [Salinibacterium metalliresistens]